MPMRHFVFSFVSVVLMSSSGCASGTLRIKHAAALRGDAIVQVGEEKHGPIRSGRSKRIRLDRGRHEVSVTFVNQPDEMTTWTMWLERRAVLTLLDEE